MRLARIVAHGLLLMPERSPERSGAALIWLWT
jgi:hypothetical protein